MLASSRLSTSFATPRPAKARKRRNSRRPCLGAGRLQGHRRFPCLQRFRLHDRADSVHGWRHVSCLIPGSCHFASLSRFLPETFIPLTLTKAGILQRFRLCAFENQLPPLKVAIFKKLPIVNFFLLFLHLHYHTRRVSTL